MESTAQISTKRCSIWNILYDEISFIADQNPILKSTLSENILSHHCFTDALSELLANKIATDSLNSSTLIELFNSAFSDDEQIGNAGQFDLQAFLDRDPACTQYSLPFLYYKGFHGLQLYRIGHWLWHHGKQDIALWLQSRVSEVFTMDIHPAAVIGQGILIDHATSIVIGETAVIGDNVSMLHEVTLGGTGKDVGDRHPKVDTGVLIGAGAKILGNVKIGKGAKIGAGSVVLTDVAPHNTVAGVPAIPVGACKIAQPALEMDHTLGDIDTTTK